MYSRKATPQNFCGGLLVILNKDKFVEVLDEAQASKAFALLKSRMSEVKQVIANPKNDTVGIVNIDANGGTVSVRKDVMLSDIDQILEAQTIERNVSIGLVQLVSEFTEVAPPCRSLVWAD